MLLSIIDEVNKALDNDLYLAALSLVLTIPDICGKAEFPDLEKQTKKRYIKWFDEHIGQYEEDPDDVEIKCPHLSGEVVYSLRNSVLHQGTPNLNKDEIHKEDNKIDRFVLIKEPKNEFDMYPDSSSCSPDGCWMFQEGIKRTYHMSIRRLCFLICGAAETYYENNKEKFDFFDYYFVDRGHEYDDIFCIKSK